MLNMDRAEGLKMGKKKKGKKALKSTLCPLCSHTWLCFIYGGIQEEHMFPGALSSLQNTAEIQRRGTGSN